MNTFDVRKNDVRVSSISDLVNVVKALLGSKFDVRSFEAKNRVRSPTNEHVRVRSMLEKMVFDPSLDEMRSSFEYRVFQLKIIKNRLL